MQTMTAQLRRVLREAFTGLEGPRSSPRQHQLLGGVMLAVAVPFVLLPTGLHHLTHAAVGWAPAAARLLLQSWWALFATLVLASLWIVLRRGRGRSSRLASFVILAMLVATNAVSALALGSLTQMTMLYTVIFIAAFRVVMDFEHGLLAVLLGIGAMNGAALIEHLPGWPLAPYAPEPIAHPLYGDRALAGSIVMQNDVALVLMFALVNYSMNQSLKLHRYITRSVLRRYLPESLVAQAAIGELDLEAPPERRVVTVLFTDLVGFTSMSEELGAEAVGALLNEYLSAMADLAHRHRGTVDKFIGDAVMVVFGAPEDMPAAEQVERACDLARDMVREAAQLGEGRFQLRAGIHTGEAVVGNFGSGNRSDYTVIGPTVNLAARLEGASEPGRVLLSAAAAGQLPPAAVEAARELVLKGVGEPVQAHLLALHDARFIQDSHAV